MSTVYKDLIQIYDNIYTNSNMKTFQAMNAISRLGKIYLRYPQNYALGLIFERSIHISDKNLEKNASKKLIVTPENIFSEENKKRFQESLQNKPQNKPLRKPLADRENIRKAAVLITMCLIDNEPSFLFMERSNHLPVHRGEICFPGGMMDNTDPDLVYTALRETHEEIGLPTENIDVWGSLQQVPSRDGTVLVTPVVAFCGQINTSDLVLNKQEVETVFTRSIASLCDPENTRSTQFRSGNGYTLPVFLGGERRIWGLTAIFVHFSLTLLAPGMYKYKVKHRS